MNDMDSTIISVNLENVNDATFEKNDRTYLSISFELKYPIVIINDFQIKMRFNVFFCEFILELRKTLLSDKIWCEKDSLIFNNFNCHFSSLNYINSSKCVVLFLMEIKSLKRPQFINYLKILQWRMKIKSSHFTLISVFSLNLKNEISIVEKELPKHIYEFIKSEIFDKGISLDSKVDLKHMVMYTVSNVLPLIVSNIYSPHQLASIDMAEFYQLRTFEEATVPFTERAMHFWSCSDLASWLEMKHYPPTLIEDIENKRVNGFVIQNSTLEGLRDFLGIATPIIRRKLIDDVYDYLKQDDIQNNIRKAAFKNVAPKLKQILIINDFSKKDEINLIFNKLKSTEKFSFCFDYSENPDNLTNLEWKPQDSEILKSKIIIVVINSKTLNKTGDFFRKDVENKILYALWLKKSILFMSNVKFLRLNQAFKILIENQPIINFQNNSPESAIKSLTSLIDIITCHPGIDLSKFGIPTIESFEQQSQISNVPEVVVKRKIILHFHSECCKKVNLIKRELEKNNFIVHSISVDQINLEFGHHLENIQLVREKFKMI